jgi:hypothetical protein
MFEMRISSSLKMPPLRSMPKRNRNGTPNRPTIGFLASVQYRVA